MQAVETPTQVSAAVSDTGPGIPEEALRHLFQRFYRADKSRSRDAGGTGLGLAIAYEIAQSHQGNLEVVSTVGSGSTFTVTLPANGDGPGGLP